MNTREQVTHLSRLILYFRLGIKIFELGLGITNNVLRVTRVAIGLIPRASLKFGYGPRSNMHQVNGKWYWHLNVPGFPSPAFERVFQSELAYRLGMTQEPGLATAFIAITKKCGLKCEHCFEWASINRPETVSEEDVLIQVDRLIHLGAGQIIFSGGEPVNRFRTLIHVLDDFRNSGVEFWINTSGNGLTENRIKQLKSVGLTGIIVSLDHHIPSEHDRFRGREGSFQNAVSSIQAANEMELVTALSLCATNAFISPENLDAYMRLAKRLNVEFVQLLEPRPVGQYQQIDVSLTPENRRQLESIYRRAGQSNSEFRGFPVVSYPDYNRRMNGCIGGKKKIPLRRHGR